MSGCVRECAEAQAKDFGIIATEKGWNLYVCGNGGAKPQHAQLLAADVDKDTLVRYLDRFLMFYIKTADPLTRTATWLNKLEGGMAYLRNVVVNDSLGIGADLEAEIALLIANYHCEWRKVVEDPELRKQFTHFVNAPAVKDPTLEFDDMLLFALFLKMANGATYSIVPLVNRQAIGSVSGIVGAGGNLGAMLVGFLFKVKDLSYSTAFLYIGVGVATVGGVVLLVRAFAARREVAEVPQVALAA